MKLGEIKIEALKLMFADYARDMSVENLSNLKEDENYATIINSMPGAINRCFGRFEDSKVVPLKVTALEKSEGASGYGRIRFDLSQIPDFLFIDRIVYEDEKTYEGNCEYIMETNYVIVLPERAGSYTLVYVPSIDRVTSGTAEDTEIALPKRLCEIMPLFIKGDLYQEDEPSIAAESRNLFEASLESFNQENTTRQTKIANTYNQTEE